ncbi:hypothetical protein F4809DRAFT_389731 [Biscogniauxia mediterranea]|nr:hypothetical protein F4809DRAFT_389731 [Biscogniauxia mediterranea]
MHILDLSLSLFLLPTGRTKLASYIMPPPPVPAPAPAPGTKTLRYHHSELLITEVPRQFYVNKVLVSVYLAPYLDGRSLRFCVWCSVCRTARHRPSTVIPLRYAAFSSTSSSFSSSPAPYPPSRLGLAT